MVDFNKPNSDQSPGGQGGPESLNPNPGQTSDTRLIARAIREQWPIPDEYREPIVNRQVRIAIDPSSSPRESTSAARCLVSMQQQNQEAALKILDKSVPDLHELDGVIEQRVTVEELLGSPDYLEYLRERERDSKPGLICTNGHAGNGQPLANGDARNGH